MHNDGCPMQMESALLREAARVASKQAVRRVHLLAEMIRLESRLNDGEPSHKLEDLRSDAENCARAAERLMSYNPIGVDRIECPHCWILNGEHLPLRSDKRSNNLRCDRCEWRHSSRSTVGIIAPRTPAAVPSRTQSPSISEMPLPSTVRTDFLRTRGSEFQMISIRNSEPAVRKDALEYHDSLGSRFAHGRRIG